MSASDLLDALPSVKDRVQTHDLEFLNLSTNDIASAGYALSETEELVLSLNERLNEIKLEDSILRALHDDSLGAMLTLTIKTISNNILALSDEPGEEQLRLAEQEVLDAKATYSLRKQILESMLATDPTLKAVHSRMQASPVERALLPLIERRDLLSMAHTQLSTDASTLNDSLSALMADNIRLSGKNRGLARILIELAEDLKTSIADDVKDARLRSQLEQLKEENRIRKSRWRLMKGVVSTVVVGSAVDWARDDELRELVIDKED
ncbi:MAG: hypothetical protein M1835_007203 [Candelina submexicana]|nr:MAG: hypothetical protein M1835_007203 [Candelina submexicana]